MMNNIYLYTIESLQFFLSLLYIFIIVDVILSFLIYPLFGKNMLKFFFIVRSITINLYKPIKKTIPTRLQGIELAPLIALLIINFLSFLLNQLKEIIL